MRLVLACLALGFCLACGQANGEAPRAYLGFAGGLTFAGPALADDWRPGGTLEGFVGFLCPDSTTIRLGFHWTRFGVPGGEKAGGVRGAGYTARAADSWDDDAEVATVTGVRATVLWPARGSETVWPYVGSGLGLVRLSFEKDRPEWGWVVSPTIGVRIHRGRSVFSVETGVDLVFPGKAKFGAVPVRVVFPF